MGFIGTSLPMEESYLKVVIPSSSKQLAVFYSKGFWLLRGLYTIAELLTGK
jgi:hypothetical protein